MSTSTDWSRFRKDVGTLVAQHSVETRESDWSDYYDNPVGFIRDVLKITDPGLWTAQIDIAHAVRDNQMTVVHSGNSIGKDFLAALLALWAVYARGMYVLITGPTERQVKEIVMKNVARVFSAASDLPGDLFQMALRLGVSETAGILAFTSDDPSKMTGLHAPKIMVIITEGQGVEDFTYETALANATGADDRFLVLGNPLKPMGAFYDICRSSDWKVFGISAFDHPNVIGRKVVIRGAITWEGVQRIRKAYGEDSPQYQARVLGQFPEESSEALIRHRWIEEAVKQWQTQHCLGWHGVATLGMDVARQGPDASCLAVHQNGAIRKIMTWRGADSIESVDRIESEWAQGLGLALTGGHHRRGQNSRSGTVIVDATGLGWGVDDELKRRGWKVIPFIASERPSDWDEKSGGEGFNKIGYGISSRFANARAEAAWRCREALEHGALPLPPDAELHEELLAMEWFIDSRGRIAIESKDELRSKLKRSPDRADAVILLAWELARPRVGMLWGDRARRKEFERFSRTGSSSTVMKMFSS